MLSFFYCDISTLADKDFLKIYENAEPLQREKINRMKNRTSQKLSLASYMLARKGIADATGISSDMILFEEGINGKPYAKGIDIYFNVSHSGNIAVCAVSDTPVGIDIEMLRKVNVNVANKRFSPKEKEYIFSEEVNQEQRFMEIWTKKEAYVKLLGTSIKDFLTFDVTEKKGIYTIKYNKYILSIALQ